MTDVDGESARRVADSLPADEGVRHESAVLNVSSPEDAAGVAFDVTDRLGLDAWVSNAGISFMHGFLDAPIAKYDQTMDVNLKGVFVCGQAAARAMVRSGTAGAIVNTASMAGKQGRVPFLSDYVASKFGVVGLTQAMAYELGEHGITVNCVCPGYVETPMQSRKLEWEAPAARHHDRRRPRHDARRHAAAAARAPEDVASPSRSFSPPTPGSSPVRHSPSTAARTWTSSDSPNDNPNERGTPVSTTWLDDVFATKKPVIAMLHLAALPGDPAYDGAGGIAAVVRRAREELDELQAGGVDGVMVSNEFSLPYLTKTEPITAITMARIIGELLPAFEVPYGVNVLWDGRALDRPRRRDRREVRPRDLHRRLRQRLRPVGHQRRRGRPPPRAGWAAPT